MREPFRFWRAVGNLGACVFPVVWLAVAVAIVYAAVRTSGAAVFLLCIGAVCLAVSVWLAHRMAPGGDDDSARRPRAPDHS